MLLFGWEVGGWVASWALRFGSLKPCLWNAKCSTLFYLPGSCVRVSRWREQMRKLGYKFFWDWCALTKFDGMLFLLVWKGLPGLYTAVPHMRGQWQHPFSWRKVQSFNTSLQSSYKSMSQMCFAWVVLYPLQAGNLLIQDHTLRRSYVVLKWAEGDERSRQYFTLKLFCKATVYTLQKR